MRTTVLLSLLASAVLSAGTPPAAAPGPAPAKSPAAPVAGPVVPERKPDVIYVPTPRKVVEEMLRMAELKPDDVVYDLGCGDGRIVIAAAQLRGVKAVGYSAEVAVKLAGPA